MRTFIARGLAVVALVTGIGLGASALPAAADPPAAAGTTTSTSATTATLSTHMRVARPADWWL